MRPTSAYVRCLAVLTLFLAACGGPTAPPPKPTVEIPTPNPLSVSVDIEASTGQTATIPLDGGSISATGSDGTVYTLTLPEAALLEETAVTMTPLAGVTGAPVAGRALGVRLEPDGLDLYREAVLEIAPADGEAFSAIGFAADQGGANFTLVPPIIGGDATSVSLPVFSFSEHGAFTGSELDPIEIVEPSEEFMPVDWEKQLAQMMAELLAKEREAQLAGEEGDPELGEKMVAILNTFYIKVIAPMLPRIATECSYSEANVAKVLSWARTALMYGMDETFANEVQAIMNAVRAGVDNCWQEAIEPCVDRHSPSFERVVSYARLNQMFGGSPEVYDPLRDDIQCDDTCLWLEDVQTMELAVSFAWSESGTDQYGNSGSVNRSWSAQAVLSKTQDYDTTLQFAAYTREGDPVAAEASVNDVYSNEAGSVTTVSLSVDQVSLSVTFDTSECTYDAHFNLGIRAETSDYGDPPREHGLGVGGIYLYDLEARAGSLAGSAQLPHQLEAAEGASYFLNGWDDAAHVLIETGLGTANVSWTLVPQPPVEP